MSAPGNIATYGGITRNQDFVRLLPIASGSP